MVEDWYGKRAARAMTTPAASTPSDELERIVGFCRSLDERCSERIFSSFLATALLCESLPLVYDRNFLRAEDPGAGANELAALADRIFGAAGMTHRKVTSDSAEIGEWLAPQFESMGWKVERTLAMVHSGSVEEERLPLVAEVTSEEMLPFWEEQNREFHPESEELVRQLTQQNLLVERSIDCQYFARRSGGRVVSGCQLYSRGGTAQIEAVGTLRENRNQGLASSVVRRAAWEAFSSGHDLVWLMADEDDWPKALYAKLGFGPVGRFYAFSRGTGQTPAARAR
jgi:ribosomal protein S18 acetylase RimI-like enzyme